MRVLGANAGGRKHGVFTAAPGTLTNDFFVNLLDHTTVWSRPDAACPVFEGKAHGTGEARWTATAVDLIFGSNSQLRAVAEAYACEDSQAKFVQDFAAAWCKVMNLDRFDVVQPK